MQHKRQIWLLPALATVLFLASCTPQKNLVYLQDKPGEAVDYDTLPAPYRLQQGDMVYVDIQSFNIESDEFIPERSNNRLGGAGGGGSAIGDPQLYITSYAINDTGYVHLPVLGAMKLSGLTINEANNIFQERVNKYLKGATGQLRLVNFKISLLGEVVQPGTYYVFQPQVNVLELISAAGDMTPYGNRQEVLVVRNIGGQEITVSLDLTNRTVLQSPYFYLQPGDIVYVQPNRLAKTAGFSTIPWGTIFSAVSSTILIINFVNQGTK